MELLEQFRNKEQLTEVRPDKFINGITHLETLNRKAIKANYNRQLNMEGLVKVMEDKDGDVEFTRFPITFSMIHNDTEVRVIFQFNHSGETAQLDMSFDDYAELPLISSIGN
jgi:hypothetical protein